MVDLKFIELTRADTNSKVLINPFVIAFVVDEGMTRLIFTEVVLDFKAMSVNEAYADVVALLTA